MIDNVKETLVSVESDTGDSQVLQYEKESEWNTVIMCS